MTFPEFREHLYGLYYAGAHAEAMNLIVQRAAKHPEHENELGYWRLCLATLLGDQQLALQILAEAVTNGQWFSTRMLRRDPDLATLQGIPEFERLVSACEELRNSAQAMAEFCHLTIKPATHYPQIS